MMLSICVTTDGHVAPTDVPAPPPRPDQAVVAVRASSVNRGELALIAARGEGWRPGQDVSGVVIDPAADGSGPPEGARVAGLAEEGAWSELVVVTASRLAVIPGGVDFVTAATLPMAGLTALRTLRLLGNVLDRHVIVTGASGGVGRLQVELAVRSGARVTALSRSDDAIDGAAMVSDLEQAAPADAALDSVGGEILGGVIGRMRPNASVVWFGSSAGQPAPLSIYDFIGHENVNILTYFSYAADASRDAADLDSLLRLVEQGHLTSTIASTWALGDADAAVRQLAAGGTRGKIVLVNGDHATAMEGA